MQSALKTKLATNSDTQTQVKPAEEISTVSKTLPKDVVALSSGDHSTDRPKNGAA